MYYIPATEVDHCHFLTVHKESGVISNQLTLFSNLSQVLPHHVTVRVLFADLKLVELLVTNIVHLPLALNHKEDDSPKNVFSKIDSIFCRLALALIFPYLGTL